jgi:hydroxymethylpyrimidine pyrophosphatase-like HAD family hydrolase
MTRRMSRQAGFSIAMGDPAPAVPRAVDVVTDINRGHRFAHAIERFILGRAQSGAAVDVTRAGARG